MPSSDIQLVLINVQDVILIGNPKISFFKGFFKKYSRFSMELLNITPTTTNNYLKNKVENTINFEISHKNNSNGGDLIKQSYFVFDLPDIYSNGCKQFKWINRIGEYIIKEAKFKLGNQLIESLTSEWIHIWNELYLDESRMNGYNRMIGNVSELYNPLRNGSYPVPTEPMYIPSIKGRKIIVPLPFWFTYLPGCEFPLCCISKDQKDKYKPSIEITLRPLKELYTIIDNGKRGRPFEDVNINQFLDLETFKSYNVPLLCKLNETLINISISLHKDPYIFKAQFTSDVSDFNLIDYSGAYITHSSQGIILGTNKIISINMDEAEEGEFFSIEEGTPIILIAINVETAVGLFSTRFNIYGLKLYVDLKSRDYIEINPSLEVNHIFLNEIERHFFQNNEHEYLIRKNQKITSSVNSILFNTQNINSYEVNLLNFKNYSDKIIWFIRRSDFEDNNQWFNFTNWYEKSINPLLNTGSIFNVFNDLEVDIVDGINFNSLSNKFLISKIDILINNQKVITDKKYTYFSFNNYYSYAPKIPENGIFMYSFGLNPNLNPNNKNWNPTRQINLSLLDNFKFILYFAPKDNSVENYQYNIYFFSESYNVLKFADKRIDLLYM